MPPKSIPQTKIVIEPGMLEKLPYFKNTLKFVDENKKIECITCKKGYNIDVNAEVNPDKYTFKKTWLSKHLITDTHIGFELDKSGLTAALKLLGKETDSSVLQLIPSEKPKCEPAIKTAVIEDSVDEGNSQEGDHQVNNKPIDNDVSPLGKQKEIELIFHIAEHIVVNHMPLDSVNDILGFAQKISTTFHPDLIKRVHTSRCTISQVVKCCIADTFKEKIFSELEKTPFSLLIDTTSDLYGESFLAILVRYISSSETIQTKLLSIIELGGSSTGEALAEKVVEELFNNDYNIGHNLIAICTDSGSNMVSSQGAGLTNRLQKIIPTLIHVRDLCHVYHNIAEDATKLFPKYIIDFVKEVCGYINRSSQREIKFKEFQINRKKNDPNFKPSELKEVPSFKEIRWLSLYKCAEYITKNWDDLKEFYSTIDVDLKDNFTAEYKLFINVLSLFLSKLNFYTTHFQSGSYLINHVITQMKTSFCEFIPYIVKSPFDQPEKEQNYFNIVYPFSTEEPLSQEQFKTINEFQAYFLGKFESFKPLIEEASKERAHIELTICKITKDFIVQVVRSMKQRLLFDNWVVMNSLIAYWPRNLETKIWTEMAKKFSNIIADINEFGIELDRFAAAYGHIRPSDDPPSAIQMMKAWKCQEIDFPLISKLAKALFVIPYTSAEVESTFSKFKVFKTPYRNKLSALNLEASILAEQFFGSQDFSILPDMYSKYPKIWESKKKKVIIPNKISNEEQIPKNEINEIEEVKIEQVISDKKGEEIYLEAGKLLYSFMNEPNDKLLDNNLETYIANPNNMKRRVAKNLIPEERLKKLKLALQAVKVLDLMCNDEDDDLRKVENGKDNHADNSGEDNSIE